MEKTTRTRIFSKESYRICMICRALINREEGIGLPKTLGKKKLFECRLPMKKLDEYTLICLAGHKKRTIAWEERSFSAWIERKVR